jgi:DNA polymerase III subunit gamma/tau
MKNDNIWAIKYRPRTLDSLLGQEFPVRLMRGALASKEKPRAWLIQGSWGSGKTTSARILAKSMICKYPSEKGESCNNCEQCQYVDDENSFNYAEVDSASFGNVEEIRTLIQEAQESPVDAMMRVFCLDESHMLSKPAQNALLKVLEEGVGQSCFMLVTTDPEKLLPTIRSRCIRINLSPVDRPIILNHLKNIAEKEGVIVDEGALKLIVDNTHGHIRDALNLAQQMSLAGPINLETTKKYLNLHLEEHTSGLLLEFIHGWKDILHKAEDLAQENSPEELWASFNRVIYNAAINSQTPGKEVDPAIVQITEMYLPRLLNTSEWLISMQGSFKVRTVSDLFIALTLLREKLGANVVKSELGTKKLGSPKRLQTTPVKKEPILEVSEIKRNLGLVLDSEETT